MKQNFVHIDNFKPGDTVATMRLNQPIASSESDGITGASFSKEHDYLVSMGAEKLIVCINSIGGNVFQGLEIFSTIQDSPMETETRVVGIAASMAGVISQAGNKRTIKQHARFHAHSPRPESGKTVGLEMLQMAYNQLKTIFISNTSMDEPKVDEMLSKETFYTPKMAMKNGLFDEVLTSSGKMPEISNEMDAAQIMNIFNQVENIDSSKNKNMEKLNSILNLSADAGEKTMIDAVVSLQAKAQENEALKVENQGLKTSVENLENSLADANKAKAVELVESAIKAGKIKAEQKDVWVENATSSFDNAKIMLDGIAGVQSSQNIMDDEGVDNGANDVENRKEWDFADWGKNDPKGLQAMKSENFAKYEKLFNAYVGE
ncbi:MAG: hypothetical protein GY822_19095 [Deltaproteobacteria bacterium]|nr:hypothetical protein [Deltaproteobacteria bacterium]